jgi:meso-butanediol dehydrogenase / (S,S)-butanediol dehydrogenase / diacetyl reductase
VRAGPMFDEDYSMQAGAQAARAFHEACAERGIDLSKTAVAHFTSVTWVFRSLVDMPADIHVDTVRYTGRHA